MSGVFVTFEGGEGAGKSTQIKRLSDYLKKNGYSSVLTREPGGSVGAEAVRQVLLSGAAEPFGAETEVLLFAAARLDHMRETILPALADNKIVLCDRFYDSTRAYQGGGDGVSNDYLKQMEEIAVGDKHPDLTIIMDIAPEIGLERVTKRLVAGQEGAKNIIDHIDRFEKDDIEIHVKRREAFLKIAADEPKRCVVVDASQDPDNVAGVIITCIQPLLKSVAAAKPNNN